MSTSSKDSATVFVRKHQFTVGAPLQFDEDYPRVTPLEYVLGAIGADLANGLLELAKRRRLEVDRVEVVVHGELHNPLTYLGVVGEEGHPGLETLEIKVYASSLEEEENLRRVFEESLRRSPLACTFETVLQGKVSLDVVI